MIKAGQVYKDKNIPYWRINKPSVFVITQNRDPTSTLFPIILTDGSIEFCGGRYIEEDCDLIAEYPTWQEAVNSKEFRE